MRSLCHHHHRVSLNLTYIPFSSLIVLSLVIEVEGHEVLLRAHGPAAAWQVHDGGRRSFQPSFLPPNHHPAKEDDAQDVAFPVIQGCGREYSSGTGGNAIKAVTDASPALLASSSPSSSSSAILSLHAAAPYPSATSSLPHLTPTNRIPSECAHHHQQSLHAASPPIRPSIPVHAMPTVALVLLLATFFGAFFFTT